VSSSRLVFLVLIFFLTSVVSVVTGSTSLITVPVMITFGIEPHVAVATNMMALIFMSAGGSLPFAGTGAIQRRVLTVSVVLTLFGSGIGALLLLHVPVRSLQLIVALAMVLVAVFSLVRGESGTTERRVSDRQRTTGYVATFALAVYGGFFSGGYVTMLTAVFVLLFGLTFLQSVATTKVINIFSSLIATSVFAWRGVVNYKLGAVLGLTMFVGALAGGHFAERLPAEWLRRVFLLTVMLLAVKMLYALF
jgi:uncharacterized membrane protein YfcA